jgi:hypothetical protein
MALPLPEHIVMRKTLKLSQGFNRIYNASLTASMRRIVAKHITM